MAAERWADLGLSDVGMLESPDVFRLVGAVMHARVQAVGEERPMYISDRYDISAISAFSNGLCFDRIPLRRLSSLSFTCCILAGIVLAST